MTEEEWFADVEPSEFFEWLDGETTSHRKLRLFGAACCRMVWHLLGNDEFQQAVICVEECVDEPDDLPRLVCAKGALETAHSRQRRIPFATETAQQAVHALVDQYVWRAAYESASKVGEALVYSNPTGTISEKAIKAAHRTLTPLLHDLFGNPFRPITCDPAWRTDTVLSLARGMYESRDFSAMPILADALQDAGCNNEDILNHCRNEKSVGEQGAKAPRTPHVRGCWVVDLVLGKS